MTKPKSSTASQAFTPGEVNQDATPAGVIYDLVQMAQVPSNNPTAEADTLALKLVFTLDPTVEHELCAALGCQHLDVTTAAGKQRMFDRLDAADVLKIKDAPGEPGCIFMKLNAGKLLTMLREMRHREKGMGLPHELVENVFGTTSY